MKEKEDFKVNIKNKNTGKKSKNNIVLYIVVPVIFTAVLLSAVVPAFIKADKLAEGYIELIQERFSADNDEAYICDDAYVPSAVESGNTKLEHTFLKGEKIGVIVCESAGINTPVYYGNGINVLGAGAGLNADYSLFGESGAVLVEGYNSSAFRNLEKLSAGDIIDVTTGYGVFKYKVSGESFEGAKADLVLCTDKSKQPFAYRKNDKLYICANKISGPVLLKKEAVQNGY